MTTNSEIQSNKNKSLYMNDITRVAYCYHFYCITLVAACKSDVEANCSCYTSNRCLHICLE